MVIAIIAVLMAILMPSLRLTREQARSIACRSNVRTLTVAWLMYKDEYDGKLVGGHTRPGARPNSWVCEPPNRGSSSIEEKKEYIEKGHLWSYVKEIDVYRCPSDRRNKSSYHKYAYRTYSIAGGMNGGNNALLLYSEIKRPATKYVFLAECDSRGANYGSWLMSPLSKRWIDPFGIWHHRYTSTIGFADGSVNMHRWYSETLIEWNELALWNPQNFSFGRDPRSGDELELEDCESMAKGYAHKAL